MNSLNVLTKTTRITRSTGFEQVKWIQDLHDRWIEADQNNRNRMFEAFMMFLDIDGGAWRTDDKAELDRQGRHATSFNIGEQKLKTLAGSILTEKFDFDYLTQDVPKSYLLENMKHLYYYDKEQYNYQFSSNKTCYRGLIHLGVEEMLIKYDIRPTGAIAFEPRLPGTVTFDINWRSDVLKDCKRAMKDAWPTASEILEHFQIEDPFLEKYADLDILGGEDFAPVENVDDYESIPEQHGSQLLVIEYRWLEKRKTTRLYGKLSNGVFLPFPLKINESQTRKLIKLLNITAEDVYEFPYEDEVLRFSTICPNGTPKPLVENEVHDVQCGFIGFFPFSATREMGINKGVMEGWMDIQRTINYRESKKDDIISAGGAGATIVNVDKLVKQSDQIREIAENKTRPDYVCAVHGNPNEVFAKFPTGDVPPDIWNDLRSLIDMFDRVGPVTPALEGQAQRDESGVLFEMRHAVTKLGTIVYYDNWMQHEEDKAEAWYNQARITYKDIYLKVPRQDAPGYFEYNTPIGEGIYGNSIGMLPRAKVIVTLSKVSPTQQMYKRVIYYDTAKMLAANPETAKAQYRLVVNKLIENMELSPKETQRFKMIADIQEQNDIIELFTQRQQLLMNMMQAKLGETQAQQMMTQLMAQFNQQMQQIGGQPQEGQPQEGQLQLPEPEGGGEVPNPEELLSRSPESPGAPVETIRGQFNP